jgi:hypothetical protein
MCLAERGVCDPQQLQRSGHEETGMNRLELRTLLRLAEPRSCACEGAHIAG